MKLRVVILLILLAVIPIITYIQLSRIGTIESTELRAVVVDGLSDEFPNETLITKVKSYLEDIGFEVDVVPGHNLSVDTYREILRSNYKVLIFRIHGGFHEEGNRVLVGLFSNEIYVPDKYRDEQKQGLVAIGRPFINPKKEVFAISPQFIKYYAKDLKGAIVMVFSCFSLYGYSMAKAFIDKGASIYIGWEGPIDPLVNDYALERFSYYFFAKNHTVSEAISKTSLDVLKVYKSRVILSYYPEDVSDLTILDIIKR